MDEARRTATSKKKNKKNKRKQKHPSCNASASSHGVQKNPNNEVVSSVGKTYPYKTDYNDHFETPSRAYDDIFPILEHVLLNKQKQKTNKQGTSKNEATIYDPYYCAGRAAILLTELFQRHKSKSLKIHVKHDKRDFYRDIQENTVPRFDILVTNPPYSEDHKERCLQFAMEQLKNHGKPFFLLMPNYIAMKEYFRKTVLDCGSGSKRLQTFYITPSVKYEYDHPDGTGHQTSPFASVWFCGLSYGDINQVSGSTKSILDSFTKFHRSSAKPSQMGIPRIATTLPELIRIGGVSGEKRKNPRQRKKMKQQAMQRAAAGGSDSGGPGTISSQHPKNNKRKSGDTNLNEHNWRMDNKRRK